MLRVAIACTSHIDFTERLLIRARDNSSWFEIVGLLHPVERTCILELARRANIKPISLYSTLQSQSVAQRSEEFFLHCDQVAADVILLARYLHFIDIPPKYRGRVINVHGSLLPEFGGRGRYGRPLQREILEAKPNITGCTVHLATNKYDDGKILVQKRCMIKPRDTVDSLYDRIMNLEIEAALEAIHLFVDLKASAL